MTGATSPTNPPVAGDFGRPARALFRLLNPPVRGLLRSPLHPVLSRQLALLEYVGAVSGRTYTIPIGYFAWDGGGVLSFSGSRWWRNLRDGRTVFLRLRGVRRRAVPTLIDSIDARAELLGEFVRHYGPKTAGRLQMGLPSNRAPMPGELRAAAARKMLIRFDPVNDGPLVSPV